MATSDVDFRNEITDPDKARRKELQAQLDGINSAGNWATGLVVAFCIMAFVSVSLFFAGTHIR